MAAAKAHASRGPVLQRLLGLLERCGLGENHPLADVVRQHLDSGAVPPCANPESAGRQARMDRLRAHMEQLARRAWRPAWGAWWETRHWIDRLLDLGLGAFGGGVVQALSSAEFDGWWRLAAKDQQAFRTVQPGRAQAHAGRQAGVKTRLDVLAYPVEQVQGRKAGQHLVQAAHRIGDPVREAALVLGGTPAIGGPEAAPVMAQQRNLGERVGRAMRTHVLDDEVVVLELLVHVPASVRRHVKQRALETLANLLVGVVFERPLVFGAHRQEQLGPRGRSQHLKPVADLRMLPLRHQPCDVRGQVGRCARVELHRAIELQATVANARGRLVLPLERLDRLAHAEPRALAHGPPRKDEGLEVAGGGRLGPLPRGPGASPGRVRHRAGVLWHDHRALLVNAPTR